MNRTLAINVWSFQINTMYSIVRHSPMIPSSLAEAHLRHNAEKTETTALFHIYTAVTVVWFCQLFNNGVGYAGDIRAKHTLVLPPCLVSPARTKSSTLHLTLRCQNCVPGVGGWLDTSSLDRPGASVAVMSATTLGFVDSAENTGLLSSGISGIDHSNNETKLCFIL